MLQHFAVPFLGFWCVFVFDVIKFEHYLYARNRSYVYTLLQYRRFVNKLKIKNCYLYIRHVLGVLFLRNTVFQLHVSADSQWIAANLSRKRIFDGKILIESLAKLKPK